MKTAGRMSHTEVSIQNDPIHAIVATGEKIVIVPLSLSAITEEDY
jgi:hypothetical protein